MFQAIQRKSSFFADFRKNGNKILLGTALSGFLCTEESRRPHLMASLGALESTSELIETSSPIRTQFWSKRILYTLLGPGFMDFHRCFRPESLNHRRIHRFERNRVSDASN